MDGGLAGAVRHRLDGPPRPGVRARRGRRQAGPGGLAGPGSRRLRPPRRIPRAAGRSLADVPGRYKVRDLPGLDEAADWLRDNRPAHYQPGIMHGDYQFANVMFAHGEPARLAAIVDWEMTTVGDPLLDLAWACWATTAKSPAKTGSIWTCAACRPAANSRALRERSAGCPPRTSTTTWCWPTGNSASCWRRHTRPGCAPERCDPKIKDAFGSMIPQLIATAAELARSLP